MFDKRIDFEEDWDLWLRIHERYGEDAFGVSERAVCYIRDSMAERHFGPRRFTVDGVPVREYFQQRYGVGDGDREAVLMPLNPQSAKIDKEADLSAQKVSGRYIVNAAAGTAPGGGTRPSSELESSRVIAGWSNSGLCDRLTSMLLAYEIGRKSGREVHWHWPLLSTCNCPFHDLFECDEITFHEEPRPTSAFPLCCLCCLVFNSHWGWVMGAEVLLYPRLGRDALALPPSLHSVGGLDTQEGEALEQDASGEIA